MFSLSLSPTDTILKEFEVPVVPAKTKGARKQYEATATSTANLDTVEEEVDKIQGDSNVSEEDAIRNYYVEQNKREEALMSFK